MLTMEALTGEERRGPWGKPRLGRHKSPRGPDVATRPVRAVMPRLTAARENQSDAHPVGLDGFKLARAGVRMAGGIIQRRVPAQRIYCPALQNILNEEAYAPSSESLECFRLPMWNLPSQTL